MGFFDLFRTKTMSQKIMSQKNEADRTEQVFPVKNIDIETTEEFQAKQDAEEQQKLNRLLKLFNEAVSPKWSQSETYRDFSLGRTRDSQMTAIEHRFVDAIKAAGWKVRVAVIPWAYDEYFVDTARVVRIARADQISDPPPYSNEISPNAIRPKFKVPHA